MSILDYIDTIAPASEELQAIWAEAKRNGTSELTLDEINAEIAAYREEQKAKRASNLGNK